MTARLRHRLSPRPPRDSRLCRDSRLHRDKRRCAHGLTLLEVILALIILGGALVAVGELIRTASRSARDARDATSAQVIADSLMSEIAAGRKSEGFRLVRWMLDPGVELAPPATGE